MSHPDEGVLQELLDGELAPADAAIVRAHLEGCPPCTAAFDELRALQVDADTIVARLPLDPPLVRPARGATPRRAPNLRLLGLAASAVLVAGTSWVLFRSSPRTAMLTGDRGDTGSGVALPLPAEERKEVEATTPAPRQDAAPPAAVEPGFRTKSLATPAAPAPQEALKQEAPQKDASADDARRAPAAQPADAPAPLASAAAPPASARLTAGAMKRAVAPSSTVAEAESRLGARLRTIDGLTPVSVEVLPPTADSMPTVRQHYLVNGVPVVLVQQATVQPARDEVTSRERDGGLNDSAAVRPGHAANAFVAGGQPATRSWEAWGNHFVLQGALPADSIDALMKRVK